MKRIVAILMTVVMLIGAMTAFAMTSHADAPDATVPKNDLVPFTYNSTGWWWKQGDTDTEAETAWKTGESVTVENGWAEQTTGVVDNNWATDAAGSVNKYFWAVREFEVPESFDLANSRLWFDLDYDDNIKIYVNGTLALEDGGWSNRKSQEIGAASDYLKVGTNVIAVSLVQGDGGYSFDLGLTATTQLDQTLSVPAGKDYTFYAQTRTNRQNAANKDVRIICVANQSWLDSIPNFVATFTFTDGTTPVELKSVGLDNVFKSITAYGTDGNIETYTAAEGAVLFGWIITEVPEAYADIVRNTPKATVVTDAGVEPDVKPGVDYETVVEEKTDINVITDGIYKDVRIYNNGADVRVGGIDYGTSKATYILAGNYEGFYDLTISYTDMDGRRIAVVVNGDVYDVALPTKTSSWDVVDENTAHKVTVTVLMKKGANVISFMRSDGYGPNLVDFDLTRNTTFGTVTNETVKKTAEQYVELNNTIGKAEDCTYGTKKIGWLDTDHYVTYSLTVPTEGKWMLKLSYLSNDNGRRFAVTINDTDTHVLRIARTASNDDETATQSIVQYMDLAAGEYTFKIAGDNGNAPNVVAIELVRIAD